MKIKIQKPKEQQSRISYDEYAKTLMNVESTLDFITHKIKDDTVIYTPLALKAFEITWLINLQSLLPKITKKLPTSIGFESNYVQTWEVESDYVNNSVSLNCGLFEKSFCGGLMKGYTLSLPEIAFGSLCLDKKNFNKLLIFLPSESEFIFNNIETILSKKIGRKSKNTIEVSQVNDCQDEALKFFSPLNEYKEKKNLECLDNPDKSII